jgi:hypothetical protein
MMLYHLRRSSDTILVFPSIFSKSAAKALQLSSFSAQAAQEEQPLTPKEKVERFLKIKKKQKEEAMEREDIERLVTEIER